MHAHERDLFLPRKSGSISTPHQVYCGEICASYLAEKGDAKRLEVVADGPPCSGCGGEGVQLAIDTTLVCIVTIPPALSRCANVSGAALQAARRRKERAYHQLVRERCKARLVVLAGEVGGRWSEETRYFLNQLARGKVRHEPAILRQEVQHARSGGPSHVAVPPRPSPRRCLSCVEVWGADGDTPPSREVESTL